MDREKFDKIDLANGVTQFFFPDLEHRKELGREYYFTTLDDIIKELRAGFHEIIAIFFYSLIALSTFSFLA